MEKLTVQINDEQNLERDVYSKAILSSDKSSLNKYREEKLRQRRLTQTIEDVNLLKQEVSDIKDMLRLLLDRTASFDKS